MSAGKLLRIEAKIPLAHTQSLISWSRCPRGRPGVGGNGKPPGRPNNPNPPTTTLPLPTPCVTLPKTNATLNHRRNHLGEPTMATARTTEPGDALRGSLPRPAGHPWFAGARISRGPDITLDAPGTGRGHELSSLWR